MCLEDSPSLSELSFSEDIIIQKEEIFRPQPSLLMKFCITLYVAHFETMHMPLWETQTAPCKKDQVGKA